MMRRRFVRHPRRYASHRPVRLRNYDQLSTAVGVLPEDEDDLAATGMERVINPPLCRVLAGSMSLLRRAAERSGEADMMSAAPSPDRRRYSTSSARRPKMKMFSAPTKSRISTLAPSSVPIVRAPLSASFMFPVPEAY